MEELEDRLPQWEFPYWFAFYRLEPFGGDVLDTQFAQLCCLLANAHRNPKKSRAFKVEDFKLAVPRKHSVGGNVKQQFFKLFNAARTFFR